MGFRRLLLKLFSQVIFKTLDTTIFKNSLSAKRDYECQILLCQTLSAFRLKSNSLPEMALEYYLKVLIDLRACNFVLAKTSMRAR